MKYNLDNRAERIINIFDLPKEQLNISVVNSTDHITAHHWHKKRTEYFYCIKGSFQVSICELTVQGKIYGKQEFKYLSDKDSTNFIKLNPYVAHGYKALESGSIMLYYMDEKYNPNDEYRLPVGYFFENWLVPNK